MSLETIWYHSYRQNHANSVRCSTQSICIQSGLNIVAYTNHEPVNTLMAIGRNTSYARLLYTSPKTGNSIHTLIGARIQMRFRSFGRVHWALERIKLKIVKDSKSQWTKRFTNKWRDLEKGCMHYTKWVRFGKRNFFTVYYNNKNMPTNIIASLHSHLGKTQHIFFVILILLSMTTLFLSLSCRRRHV